MLLLFDFLFYIIHYQSTNMKLNEEDIGLMEGGYHVRSYY